ncbi:MAG: hypothetical protein B7X02_02930 [Rhodospirillales bacterium 12-54-5]|nr:MAG: hypothetical protein B7X02_02930 [Rhodospirillales bacterium 12-54-5]
MKIPGQFSAQINTRSLLLELVAAMNGWNNGQIAVSQRTLAAALKTTNFRTISRGIAELMEHGLIDVAVEGQWKERMARQYRLTFVSTKTADATNDYRFWEPPRKSGADTASAEGFKSADVASARTRKLDDAASARITAHRRKTANS